MIQDTCRRNIEVLLGLADVRVGGSRPWDIQIRDDRFFAWEELRDRYDERFHRIWRFFLLACAGGFCARWNQLWQVLLSRRGIEGGYRAPR